jgi:hypothetical protein
MHNKIKKHHITTLLAAMAMLGSQSAFAATFGDNLQDDNQAGTTYVSAQDGDTIRFGELNTSSGGGAAIANTAINPTLQGGAINLDYVYTSLNSVTPDQTTTLQGGLVIDPNTGNTTVAQGGSQTASLSSDLIRVRRLEVYNQNEGNQALWGQAVDPVGVTQYGYVDDDGNFVEVSLSGAAAAAFDTFVATPSSANAEAVFAALTPDDITALGSLYTPGTLTPTAGTGNLTVEGATSTNGLTNTGAISTDSLTVGGVAAATVDDVTAGDNAVRGEFAAADNVVRSEFAAADAGLQAQITAEVNTRDSLIRQEADGIHIGPYSLVTDQIGDVGGVGGQQALFAEDINGDAIDIRITNGSNLVVDGTITQGGVLVATVDDVAAEAADRQAADTQLQANIDTVEAESIDRDVVLGQRIDTLDTRVTTQVARLDGRIDGLNNRTTALEGRMSTVERDVRSLRKGVAMAAALQTPVINSGDKMAVKVGAATYDGEQGVGLGFAGRVTDSVTVNVDVATGFPETVARGGLNLSF